MNAGLRFGFDNTYARLPERFHARVNPARVAGPRLVKVNAELAELLGLDVAALESAEGVEVLAGNAVAEGSEPLAMAYAGHQFGHFVPQLGDGRANLLGEVVGRDGKRYDLQLKGSGRTPFSRGGDGKAALGPVLREYLVSEAMHAMGVPTTRALAAVVTGERVARETMLPGAVLCRVAASHLRVGTFQYFASRGDAEGVKELAGYAMARHYPEVGAGDYVGFLRGVVGRHARLAAQWMLLGFVHGVMNTDNCSISGETIDYGPCAFLEAYDPETVFSSIDHAGRYGYGNQPGALLWNLMRLAECLLPLLDANAGRAMELAKEVLGEFEPEYERARAAGLAAKVGVAGGAGARLAEDYLVRMAAGGVDFTLGFRRLCDAASGDDAGVRGLFRDPGVFDEWAVEWRRELQAGAAAAMRGVNPAYVPRNHLVQAVIEAGVERGDFGPFEELLSVVTRPFENRAGLEKFKAPAREEEVVRATFCGT